MLISFYTLRRSLARVAGAQNFRSMNPDVHRLVHGFLASYGAMVWGSPINQLNQLKPLSVNEPWHAQTRLWFYPHIMQYCRGGEAWSNLYSLICVRLRYITP